MAGPGAVADSDPGVCGVFAGGGGGESAPDDTAGAEAALGELGEGGVGCKVLEAAGAGAGTAPPAGADGGGGGVEAATYNQSST